MTIALCILLSFLAIGTFANPAVKYWVNLPEEVPKAREEILQQLTKKYFDDLKQCCQSVNSGGSIDCNAFGDPNKPSTTLNLNGAESVVKQFYYKCLAHGRDSRKCCAESGVSAECLSLCNAASPPADEALEAALVRCEQFKAQTSKCFHWSMYSGGGANQMHFADEEKGKEQ